MRMSNFLLILAAAITYSLKAISPNPQLISDAFPLSRAFKERNVQIHQTLRGLAVQVTNRWTKESMILTVRKHYYRAVLHVLFTRHSLDPVVGKQRDSTYEKGFQHYVRTIVQRLNLPETLIEEANLIEHHDDGKVVAAVCLRGMCAAVVESIIILDRFLAITENLVNGYVGLHRIFDPEISPRGWALIALR